MSGLQLEKQKHSAALAERKSAEEQLRRLARNSRPRAHRASGTVFASLAEQHKFEATVTRLRHERQTLCEGMQDDYGINLEEAGSGELEQGLKHSIPRAPPAPSPRPPPIAPPSKEIAALRHQINNIDINLEALDQPRPARNPLRKTLRQYRDLVDAKASLERITQRINIDSRQLFLSTVEIVRGHFQELFRRLFGGGEADIIIDEAEDVLESGIEIVARPPGKEACSISLLSGGEKTLTCVALLLAVFRSKPSPFCILDEVDAALDEANIGRFTAVLKEFLSFTQFIVITHSKKTMAGADTLVRRHDGGVGRLEARFGSLRRCLRRWPHPSECRFSMRGNSRRLPWQWSMPSHRQVRSEPLS